MIDLKSMKMKKKIYNSATEKTESNNYDYILNDEDYPGSAKPSIYSKN
mgnify:CR=1 FL=1